MQQMEEVEWIAVDTVVVSEAPRILDCDDSTPTPDVVTVSDEEYNLVTTPASEGPTPSEFH